MPCQSRARRQAIIFALMVSCGFADEKAAKERPANWAKAQELAGVPNCFKVSDRLYRSAQPTRKGMHNLKRRGIVTVLNLRSFHSDRDELEGIELASEHISMTAWSPKEEEIVRFLQIVSDSKKIPVLIHCQHGADRTGVACAAYRIVVENWSKEEAIREMTDGGFGFHFVWIHLVDWVRELDVERVRKKAGLPKNPKNGR